MIEEPLRLGGSLPFCDFFSSCKLTISFTIAWFRHPSAINSPPHRCISFSSALPALSMKLTAHRLTLNFCRGAAAYSSRQHCSRAATHCPANRPSTVKTVLLRLLSVVIRSMSPSSLASERCKSAAKAKEYECRVKSWFVIYLYAHRHRGTDGHMPK